MESEICSNKSKIQQVVPNCIIEAESLLPIAPTPERNNDSITLLTSDSPLTSTNDSPGEEDGVDLESTPRTPKADVFDPFAPGPDDLANAPLIKKFAERSKIDVVRRLNFGDSPLQKDDIFQEEEDEVLLGKILYESFLDVIFSTNAQERELAGKEVECGGGGKVTTPTKLPLLNGIADTCPGAPRKSKPNSRLIDLGLCRKLEF